MTGTGYREICMIQEKKGPRERPFFPRVPVSTTLVYTCLGPIGAAASLSALAAGLQDWQI